MTTKPQPRAARILRWMDDPMSRAPGYPPVLLGLARWSKLGGLIIGGAYVMHIARDIGGVTDGPRWPAWLWAIAGAGVLVVVLSWVATIGLIRWARRAEYAVCVHCATDLSDSDAAGACPGCGWSYEREAARRAWMNAGRVLRFGSGRRS